MQIILFLLFYCGGQFKSKAQSVTPAIVIARATEDPPFLHLGVPQLLGPRKQLSPQLLARQASLVDTSIDALTTTALPTTIAPPTVTTAPPTAVTTAPPAVTTAPPAVTTAPPGVTTAPPGVTTAPPAVTTAPPGVTTAPPAVTTAPPAVTAPPTAVTTAVPSAATDGAGTAVTSPATDGGGGGCKYAGSSYPPGEEWDYYTTSKDTVPYYGFKLKCLDKVTVLGCFENENYIEVDSKRKSDVYKGYDISCSAGGFNYVVSDTGNNCQGHEIGDFFNQGFYRYECTKEGLVVIACLDLEEKERKPGEVYDVLGTYRMQCLDTPKGLVVEAIACIDENSNLVEVGGSVRGGWFKRTCVESRDSTGLQTAVALNLTECCEWNTDHCIPINSEAPSTKFADQNLIFECIKTEDEFSYQYKSADTNEVVTFPPEMFTTQETTQLTTAAAGVTTAAAMTTAANVTQPPPTTVPQNLTTIQNLTTMQNVTSMQPPMNASTSPQPLLNVTRRTSNGAIFWTITETLTQAKPTIAPTLPVTLPNTLFVTVTKTVVFPTTQPAPTQPPLGPDVTPDLPAVPTIKNVSQAVTAPSVPSGNLVPTRPQVVYVTVTETIQRPPASLSPTVTRLPTIPSPPTPQPPRPTPTKPPLVYLTVTETLSRPPATQTPNFPQVPSQRRCGEKWVALNGKCYYVSEVTERTTAENAERNCFANGAQLLVIEDQIELELVKGYLEQIRPNFPANAEDGFFIGLRFFDDTGNWRWIRPGGIRTIPWHGASAGPRRKRQIVIEKKCGEIRWSDLHWGMDREHCLHKQWFICEKNFEPPTFGLPADRRPTEGRGSLSNIVDMLDCPDGWLEYDKRCYFFSKPRVTMSYEGALQICQSHGGKLVVIKNQNEWNFLEYETTRRASQLSDRGFDGFWIGLSLKPGSNQWSWTGPGGMGNIPWFPDNRKRQRLQKQAFGTGNNCGEIRTDFVRWAADKDHCSHQQGFICEKDLSNAPGDCRIWKYQCSSSSAECMETPGGYRCVCKPGFRGDGYTCLDVDECIIGRHACAGMTYCQNTLGSYACYCNPGYKEDPVTKQCQEYGVCVTYGDPHYRSFDGKTLHYQGKCRNILVMPKTASSPFTVESTSEVRDEPNYTWTRDMYLKHKTQEYGLMKDSKITVNGVSVNVPFTSPDGKISIMKTGTGIMQLKAPYLGVDMVFDGMSRGEVHLSSKYRDLVAGLCGNYNGKKDDDWISPNGTLENHASDESMKTRTVFQITDPVDFGNSWIVPDYVTDTRCQPDSSLESECEPGKTKYNQAEPFCESLRGDGPLAECYKVLGINPVSFYHSCVIDVCATGPRAASIAFENMATVCNKRGVELPVPKWCADMGCTPKECPENMEYMECGPSCPETCASVLGHRQTHCTQSCQEGCFCISGYVFNGDGCVKPEQCGCLIDGTYITMGQVYLRNKCTESCTCVSGSSRCGFGSCHFNADCISQNTVDFCQCKPGFTGNGINCVDIDECATGQHNCDLNTPCRNTQGSFTCACKEGYTLDPPTRTCRDIDECREQGNPCGDPLAICTNFMGTYDCSCPKGYLMRDAGKRKKRAVGGLIICEDIDECTLGRNVCDGGSACTNTPGSYTCACAPGFTQTPGGVCLKEEICNPFTPQNNKCHSMAQCITANGQNRCLCLPGYEGDGISYCRDVNECGDPSRNPCAANSRCINTPGSVRCECPPGFRNVNDVTCIEINECDSAQCGPYGSCVNSFGSYRCECNPGFQPSMDGSCKDVDECEDESLNSCDENAYCVNTAGSHLCQCEVGYTGNGMFCKVVDGCDICGPHDGQACSENGHCINDHERTNGFECVCLDGYEGDGVVCVDINECVDPRLPNPCPPGSQCVNTAGSFQCKCPPGTMLEGTSCVDVDECAEIPALCDINAVCTNSYGSIQCQCKPGYAGTGKPGDCYDVDECQGMGERLCGGNSRCLNIDSSYQCRCLPGYMGFPCQDIDECLDQRLHNCDSGAKCVNSPGSFNCICEVGFQGDGTICQKTDPCENLQTKCHEYGFCLSSPVGPQCKCKEGFSGDGYFCQDIDECESPSSSNGCGIGSVCVNTMGSFSCKCGPGFTSKDPLVCLDVDECRDPSVCSGRDMTCTNTYGSYMCSCPSGFRLAGDGAFCQDIDECAIACLSDPNRCQSGFNPLCSSGVCRNTQGSYQCQANFRDIPQSLGRQQLDRSGDGLCDASLCQGPQALCLKEEKGYSCQCGSGYTPAIGLAGFTCIDEDECASQRHNCTKYSYCINTVGSFLCSCMPGFQWDGRACIDVNECDFPMKVGSIARYRMKRGVSLSTSSCHQNAVCENRVGGYACKCKSGYRGDGLHSCLGSFTCFCGGREGNSYPDCSNVRSSALLELNICSPANAESECSCAQGHIFHENSCIDVDECVLNFHNCTESNSHCINSVGSFLCTCVQGFAEKSDGCVDIDECASSVCGESRHCQNTIGSFRCTCPQGYRENPFDPSQCQDINECLENLPLCGSAITCVNTPGSFACKCPAGYYWDSSACKDIDECQVPKICSAKASCINVPGSFHCQCSKGHTGDGKLLCQEMDECLQGTHLCSQFATCTDTPDSYKCECRRGFLGDGMQCQDVNECSELGSSACPWKAACFNTMGSYACHCRNGLNFLVHDNGTHSCQDSDECGVMRIRCGLNQVCKNTHGSYECVCADGFILDSANQCVDLDECVTGIASCVDRSLCLNVAGSYHCQCPDGYFGDGKTMCSDVDECSAATGSCKEGEVCLNTVGSYTCACKPGYSWDTSLNKCTDKRQAVELCEECHREFGECQVEASGVIDCKCKEGYAGDGEVCEDVDECTAGLDTCPPLALCQNTPGSYKCQCLTGYEEIDSGCRDINECQIKGICDPNAECTNLEGNFECRCKKCFVGNGYSCSADPCCKCGENAECDGDVCRCNPGFFGDGTLCKPSCDSNKCSDEATCIPDPTADLGYICKCNKYLVGDGFSCEPDVPDNCVLFQVDCGNGTCLPGAKGTDDYTCVCGKGFQFLNGGCVDYNECASEADILCGNAIESRCINSIGSYQCSCQTGYIFDSDQSACYAINKALRKPPDCSQGAKACRELNADCVDLEPYGYKCECKKGFARNNEKSGACIRAVGRLRIQSRSRGSMVCPEGYEYNSRLQACKDLNECSNGSCPENSSCANYEGGYSCTCKNGFGATNDSTLCLNVDECKLGWHLCPQNTFCRDTVGSYECPCLPGFKSLNQTCIKISDLRECGEICGENGECRFVSGNVKCVCKPGFTINKTQYPSQLSVNIGECIDISECEMGIDLCHSLAECKNTVGSYICECFSAFIGNGSFCRVKDPCAENVCHEHAACHSQSSTNHTCTCHRGYIGDGVHCALDKCAENNGGCPPSSSCAVEPRKSRISCTCYPGYAGPDCVDLDECLGSHVCGEAAKCYNMPGSYSCYCEAGYTGDAYTGCFDIDECMADEGPCSEMADCINTAGHYECRCRQGSVGDGRSCAPDRLCQTYHGCGLNAVCTQTDNTSFACICMHGFAVPSDSVVKDCQDVDECSDGVVLCALGKRCINTIGSYYCQCPPGYEQVGDQCKDIDECTLGTDYCGFNQECINLNGSYQCICPSGFTTHDSDCTDLNECLSGEDNCGESQECINSVGSFRCACPPGLKMDFSQTGCIDLDECEETIHSCNATTSKCRNTHGSYYCKCRKGYQKIGNICQEWRFSEKNPCSRLRCPENAHCIHDEKTQSASCQCRLGFTGNGHNFCEAINFCSNAQHRCSRRAECIQLPGGYDCKCNLGFAGNGFECHDVDECKRGGHSCDPGRSECVNTVGSFHCRCKTGYKLSQDTLNCHDVDECVESPWPLCDADAVCVNTEGSYICLCREGRTGSGKLGDCTSLPECLTDVDCGLRGICRDQRCTCSQGFRRHPDYIGCQDVDECEEDLAVCSDQAFCENTNGNYTCMCFPGYYGDGEECRDIDECLEGWSGCGRDAECENGPGFFSCSCPDGGTGDGFFCQTILTDQDDVFLQSLARNAAYEANQCDDNKMSCGQNAMCVRSFDFVSNSTGKLCVCQPGYQGNPYSYCFDINECLVESGRKCDTRAECINTPGSYQCNCRPGLTGDGRIYCHDVDECVDPRVCPSMAKCQNTWGSYSCQCPLGYRLNNQPNDCVDINECEREGGVCHPLAECHNIMGSYVCTCPPGWAGDGRLYCQKNDDCKTKGPCDANAICVSKNLGAECVCRPGFHKLNGICTDVDECLVVQNPCSSHGICINTIGSYICKCKDGFVEDGSLCLDRNECQLLGICQFGSDCQNTVGSYKCVCRTGFLAANGTCEDLDECELSPTPCHPHSCRNVPGSFVCRCSKGYRLNVERGTCSDVDECGEGNPCPPSATCYNTLRSYTCLCNHGFRMKNDACVDVDECKSNPCDSHGKCVNSPGSFTCLCQKGYLLANMQCIDVDECLEPPGSSRGHKCSTSGLCFNKPGSYDCKCKAGYIGNGRICYDIDECTNKAKLCGEFAKCINTNGSYSCLCKPGFVPMGNNHCIDKNECVSDEACKNWGNARCVNALGSYLCLCHDGYSMNKDGTKCDDVNECGRSEKVCGKGRVCLNTPGSYRCECPHGYVADGSKCKDWNECAESPCDRSSVCVNSPGSYECVCNPGFKLRGGQCKALCSEQMCPRGYRCKVVEGQGVCTCDLVSVVAGKLSGPVCTKRHESFPNAMAMARDACLRNITHQLDYYGKCLLRCKSEQLDDSLGRGVICPGEQRCGINPQTKRPTCL